MVVAIPCFNTRSSVCGVITEAKKHADKVIIIDDGSLDGTAEVARAAGAEVVRHGVNRGYGGAIHSCFEVARTNCADILVILDGDGQHSPEDIPGLLVPIISQEADLVIGSRFLDGRTADAGVPTDGNPGAQMPPFRAFGIKVITSLFNFGSKTKVSDAQSGFRAYNRRVLNVLNLKERGMGISIEILAKAKKAGLVIQEVPISCLYFQSKMTMRAIKHGLGVALNVVRIRLAQMV